MSFWGGIKSFFEATGKAIESWFGSASVEQKVQGGLTVVGAAIVTITSLTEPLAAPEVSAILKQIQTWYGTLCAVVQQGTAVSGSTLGTALSTATTSLQANVNALISDAGVKNAASQAKIEAEAATILNELEAIEAAFLPAAPATPAA
jgi:hypothetical protein